MPAAVHHISGRELVAGIQREGTKAFDELFRRLYAPLCVFASNFVPDKEAVQDLVSDLFLRLWETRENLSNIQDVPAYLYIATRNRCLKYLQKTRTEQQHQQKLQQYVAAAEHEETLLSHVTEAEIAAALHEAITQLPPECANVITLVLKGRSTSEIASHLGISASAVSNQKARAVKLLRDKLPPATWLVLYALWG